MSDMLKTFVETELEKQIKEKYPHMQHPAGVYAKVMNVIPKEKGYICTLKLLDRKLNPDDDFPEVPGVKTTIAFQKGEIAVVLLMYGGNEFTILGRHEA